MTTRLPSPIYPVVDHPDWVARLGAAGATFIQLRLKDLDQNELRRQIKTGQDYARQHGVCLVLNDYWELALELGIEYLHLGQEDLDTADRDAIGRAGVKLGISTHSHTELDRALALKPDYVALGPIWETTLKKMIWDPQGTERLREWRALCGHTPLVAIGGITFERASACIEAGADSIAAVSDFIKQPDPENQVVRWLAATSGTTFRI